MHPAFKKPQDLLLLRKRLLRRKPGSESELPIASNGVSVVPGGPDDLSDSLAVMPSADNIPHIHNACLSIRHLFPPVVGD